MNTGRHSTKAIQENTPKRIEHQLFILSEVMKNKWKKMLPDRLQRSLLQLKQLPARQAFQKNVYPQLSALKCQIAYNEYGAYCVPESAKHRPAARKILANDIYEPETIAFMRKHCKDGDIVHAGTFFGDFLPAIAATCRGKIWAFEPNPQSYRCAQITQLLNDLSNVELQHAGLGEHAKRSFVQTCDEHGGDLGGASHVLDIQTSGSSEVHIISIDETIPTERQVSIIQLDIEGYEEPALKGALQTIKRCQPIIILEITPESQLLQSPWLNNNILSQGYVHSHFVHGNAILMPADS